MKTDNKLQLVIPDICHEKMYTGMMERWEATGEKEIIGSIVMNHSSTHRGHLHAGIAPWHQGKGYGTIMLELALEKCRENGLKKVEIVPHKDNIGAVKTILNNGGTLIEEFCEEDIWSQRYEIQL